MSKFEDLMGSLRGGPAYKLESGYFRLSKVQATNLARRRPPDVGFSRLILRDELKVVLHGETPSTWIARELPSMDGT